MWSKLNNNLAFKVALYIVLTATLLGIFIGSFQVWSNFKERKQRNTDTINSIIATTQPSISLATYNFNMRLNQQLVDGLAGHPEIINASITDAKGSELAIAAQPGICPTSNLNALLHGSNNQFEFPLAYQTVELGKLTIELNYCKLTDEFFAEVKYTLLSNIILSISIAFFIYFIFYQLVSAPLTSLVNKLQGINPAEIEFSHLQKFNSRRKDEIGQLVNHFSELLRTTHDHINRLKSAEHTINNYSTNLEELVGKRTKALTGINRQLKEVNQELESSQKLSEQYNQSQFKLLTGLSREFKLPINNTLQSLQEAQESCQTAAEHSRIESSIKQNKVILSLLKELNKIADLKSSSAIQESSPFIFSKLFENIENNIHQQESEFSLEVKYDDLSSHSHIGDTKRIEQLLFNLIANTYQCSKQQAVKVQLTEVNQSVQILISAHGLHIPEHYLDLMILPFNNPQAHSRITALGLGFAKDLAELLAGNIKLSLNSQNEHEISLLLPLQSSDEQLQTIRQQLPAGGIRVNLSQQLVSNRLVEMLQSWQLHYQVSNLCNPNPVLLITDQIAIEKDTSFIIGLGKLFEHKESHQGIDLLTLDQFDEGKAFSLITSACQQIQDNQHPQQFAKVLLVEDNAINRMLSQRFLKNLNTEIDLVEDGREALTICNNKKFDLIFMDCQMPVMDGFQATRQIRRSHLNQLTPIVALTGLDSENERQACLQAGMNDFITKPFTQEQLQNAIIQWLPSDGESLE
jgi:CheY-like chemotaxis protein/signal transduction histidine kinase